MNESITQSRQVIRYRKKIARKAELLKAAAAGRRRVRLPDQLSLLALCRRDCDSEGVKASSRRTIFQRSCAAERERLLSAKTKAKILETHRR